MVVDLAATPGWPALLAGGLVLLAGVGVTAWGGMTRIWINAATDRDGTLLAVRVAAPAAGQDQVAQIATALAEGDDDLPGAEGLVGADENAGDTSAVSREPSTILRFALAAVMLGGAVLMVALPAQAGATPAPEARGWAFTLRNLLAGAGLAVWIPALAASLLWATRSAAPGEAAPIAVGHTVDPLLPPDVHVIHALRRGALRGPLASRAGDPGRAVALAGFPLLTLALLVGGVWNWLAFAVPWRAVAGEMWLFAAWFMAGAYLHATSGWRPLRVPAWFVVTARRADAGGGVAAALTAGSLLL